MSVQSLTGHQIVRAANAPAASAIAGGFSQSAPAGKLNPPRRMPQSPTQGPALTDQMQAALLQLQAGGTQPPTDGGGASPHAHPARSAQEIAQNVLTRVMGR